MAKDPAFLFYYQDFLTGTEFMSLEAVGAYIRALCHQAHKGSLPPQHMKIICNSRDEIMSEVCEKFDTDKGGNFFNKRLREEIEKRKKYSESRRKNRLSGSKSKKKTKKHMSNTSLSYDKHMENENENENENKDIDKNKGVKSKRFVKPTVQQIHSYMKEKKCLHPLAEANKFYDFYESKGWKVGKTPMKSWEAAVRNWIRSKEVKGVIDWQ